MFCFKYSCGFIALVYIPLNSVGYGSPYSTCNKTPTASAPSWRIKKMFTPQKMKISAVNVTISAVSDDFVTFTKECAVCFRYARKRLSMTIKPLYEVTNIAARQTGLNSYVIMCEMIHNIDVRTLQIKQMNLFYTWYWQGNDISERLFFITFCNF